MSEIKTQGNFLVIGDNGERIAAFACEADAIAFKAIPKMLEALRAIGAGSLDDGRWLDASGTECDEDDEGATWEEYSDDEQLNWLASVAHMAQAAIVAAGGKIDG